jgi:hypothetical protein
MLHTARQHSALGGDMALGHERTETRIAGTIAAFIRDEAWADKKLLRGEMVLLRDLKAIAFNFQRCCGLEQ